MHPARPSTTTSSSSSWGFTFVSSLMFAMTAFGALVLFQKFFRSSFFLFANLPTTKRLGASGGSSSNNNASAGGVSPPRSSTPLPTPPSSSLPPATASSISRSTSMSALGEPKQHAAVALISPPTSKDSSSFANFAQVSTSHLAFEFDVNFDTKTVSGHVDLTLVQRNKLDPCLELVLDTRDLVIYACLERGNHHHHHHANAPGAFRVTDFTLDSPAHPVFGAALRIAIGPETTVVRVKFSTTAQSSALQWLTPAQTTGKRHPFLFSQSQAIHARSFFPCQDTPAVKFTYEAVVRIAGQAPLVALMSAISQETNPNAFCFKQNVPMPAYLVALVVGELESREISPRARVWSEPSVVEASQREFAIDTERFLSCAEQFIGEYVWGRYDLLVLPNSFPYGGMENPCMVFLTPTLLAGDRSLVNVLAHELCHSYYGNLVTNASWADFWLNEGFTVFNERKIVAKLYGEQRAALQTALGIRHWREDVERFGHDHEFTKLHIEMEGVDPDDSFSSIPYEKGCAFLTQIEKRVGGPTVFEPFLRAYVLKFRFGFVDAEAFKAFLFEHFPALDIDWDVWVHAPGIPELEEEPSVLVEMSEAVADAWIREGKFPAQLARGWSSWSCDQIMVFLDRVLEQSAALTHDLLVDMDRHGHFSNTRNCEIRFKWNCINLRMPEPTRASVEDTVEFVAEQGRMKYVRPLYRELNRHDAKLAVATFQRNKDFYHNIAQKMIAKDLGLEAK